jgi:hypothetical protein
MTLDVYSHVMPQEEIPVETWLRLIGRSTFIPHTSTHVERRVR